MNLRIKQLWNVKDLGSTLTLFLKKSVKTWIQFKKLLGMCLIISLAACKPAPVYYEAKAEYDKSKTVISETEQVENLPPAPVVTQSGPYVDKTRISLVKAPMWTHEHVILHGVDLPFSFYVTQVLGNTGAKVHFDSSVDRKRLISVNYTGTLKGALDELALRGNFHYDIDYKTNKVSWSSFITRTFQVSFMPGTSQYQVGNSAGATPSLSSASSSGGGGGAGSGGGSAGVDLTSDSQYSQITGTISIWKDVEATIKNLLSPEGRFTVSQATTSITITDYPVNVKAVENYLRKMNRELSKQVRLQVQVVEVQLTKDFSYGINWDVVRNYTNYSLQLTAPLAANTSISTLTPAGILYSASAGKWAGTNTILLALQQQGKLSVVTQPALTTLNNQVAQIAIQNMQNYISQIEGGSSDSGSGSTVSLTSSGSTVQTSTLTTGMNLYLLPKIQDGKVYLSLSTTLSNLISLDKFNSTTGQSSPTGTDSSLPVPPTPGAQPAYVQLPNINARTINQRAVIPSGATLVLAGFKDNTSTTNNAKLYNSDALGAQAAEVINRELVVLITPTILSSEFDEIGVEG